MIKRTAIILCGGKGTRLGSLSRQIPKCLVKIHSHPIIWFIINILKKNSFNHFILPVGYKGKMIKDYVKKDKLLKNLNIGQSNIFIECFVERKNIKIKVRENIMLSSKLLDDLSKINGIKNITYT